MAGMCRRAWRLSSKLPGVGPEDGQRCSWPRAWRSRPAGRPARAPRRKQHRHCPLGGSGSRRAAARAAPSTPGMDASLRHADSSRPPHLQTEAALRSLRRPRRLQLLPRARRRRQTASRALEAGSAARDARAIQPARRSRARSDPAAFPRRDEERRRHRRGRTALRTCSPKWRSSRRDSLFGLYHGTPFPSAAWAYGNALPDRISIYQRPDRGGV